MRQLISGGIVGIAALFTFNSDSTKFAQHTEESVKIIEVMSTKELIEQTDLYHRVQSIEKEIDSLDNEDI